MITGASEVKAKILYIDDDRDNRLLVNRLLSSYDFCVIEAATGLEGIRIARQENPNLILMDINMPGLDGHETTTRMRTIPALAKTPIIALTARTPDDQRLLPDLGQIQHLQYQRQAVRYTFRQINFRHRPLANHAYEFIADFPDGLADGWLWTDGECIYRFEGFGLA